MENMVFVDSACFYLKEGKAAVLFDDLQVLADECVYDGKNTLVLAGVDEHNYVVQNIVPEVREVLTKADEIMVILQKGEEISGAYEIKLLHHENLGFSDEFFEKAAEFFSEMVNLAGN